MAKERFKMPIAVHLVLVSDAKILMLRRSNTGYEDGKWSVPAGHIKQGESGVQAMAREAREEVNIEIVSPIFIHLAHKKDPVDGEERMDMFFRCESWKGGIINNEPDKCSELAWFPLDHLPDLTIAYIRSAMSSISKCLFYSEFGWGYEGKVDNR